MHGLAPFRVRNADHRRHQNRGVRCQRGFDFHRVDVETAADDHVLETVDDVQETVVVDVTQVTRFPRTVFKLGGRRFRVFVIVFNHSFAANTDLAGFAYRQRCAVGIGDKHFNAGCRAAGRRQALQRGGIAGLVRGLVERGESGTYLGFNDGIQSGGHNLSLIAARNPFFGLQGPLGANEFLRLQNGHTFTPSNSGDFGLMAKWSPAWLDGTLGIYYRKTSDILPNLALQPGAITPAAIASGTVGSYNQFYVDDIDIYGLSLAKNIAGVSVGFDLNYRHNMALSSVPATVNPTLGAAGAPGFISSFDGQNGVARGNTVHAVLNGLTTFGETPLWDSSSLLVELAYSRWLDVTDNKQLFKGEDWYNGVDKVSKDNYIVGMNFNPTWYQVFPGIDMFMPVNYNVGLACQSSVQLGGNKGTGSYAVGVGMDVHSQYRFDLKYVDNFGDFDTCGSAGNAANHGDGAAPGANGQYNCVPGQTTAFAGTVAQLKDRGMVTFTFKTTL